ncbi:hypothetical protein HHL28_01240 [Aerophototrophica crusticola]|uniref:Uncharacterized protein n=1 Tax=Aerophototrophica crusticola TaxID=1709002 RepID=A0A858R3F8_9PROT|nr:hypothetical protein HHL28_01240 [Rhodospirillaceae bacterium B3]
MPLPRLRRCAAPALLALAAGAGPALSQAPTSATYATTPANACEVNFNFLDIAIPPDVQAIPFIFRPFTSYDEWPEDKLELYRQCEAYLANPPVLVRFDGSGPGLRPVSRIGDTQSGPPPARPGLPGEPESRLSDPAQTRERAGAGALNGTPRP